MQIAKLQAELQSFQGAQRQDGQRQQNFVNPGPTELATRFSQSHQDHTAALGAGEWDAAASSAQSLIHFSAAMRNANAAAITDAEAKQTVENPTAKSTEVVGRDLTHRPAPY